MKETKSVGGTFTESQNINKSLLTLGKFLYISGNQFFTWPVLTTNVIKGKQIFSDVQTPNII